MVSQTRAGAQSAVDLEHVDCHRLVDSIEANQSLRRLNPRGNRQLNWAIHVIAVSQLRYDSPGRTYYDRGVAEGKSTKDAIRALKRRISNVVYRHLIADAHRAAR